MTHLNHPGVGPREPIDHDVRNAYRALPDEDLPAELDDSILEEARDALSDSQSRSWTRWSGPIAVAASMLVVVVVLLDLGARDQAMPASAEFKTEAPQSPSPVTDAAQSIPSDEIQVQSSRPEPTQSSPQRRSAPAAEPARTPPPSAVMVDTQVRSRALNLEGLEELPQPPREAHTPPRELIVVTSDSDAHAEAAPIATADRATAGRPADAGKEREVLRAETTDTLRVRLEQIYVHRQSGRLKEAQRAIERLRAEFPQIDVEAELKAMEAQRAQGSSSLPQ